MNREGGGLYRAHIIHIHVIHTYALDLHYPGINTYSSKPQSHPPTFQDSHIQPIVLVLLSDKLTHRAWLASLAPAPRIHSHAVPPTTTNRSTSASTPPHLLPLPLSLLPFPLLSPSPGHPVHPTAPHHITAQNPHTSATNFLLSASCSLPQRSLCSRRHCVAGRPELS